jgi:zinc protease
MLPNGLRYYILENSKPEGRASLTLAVHAGSVLETDEEQGLAHFVEHMAFNGTRRFPESELINYLRSLGMRFGPEVNAYTSYDETVYGIEVPTETGADGVKRIPEKALAVLDDWTHAITFTPKDVDDERLVIMEEYRTGLGAGERIREQILPVIFAGSPYAQRRPIGQPEIIQNAPAERLEGFYKTWYRTDNMALILVGDFDAAALEAELAAHFNAPPPNSPLKRPRYELPAPKKGSLRVEIFTDPELPYTQISLYYKRKPQEPGKDLASYRRTVINNLISRMLSFRFDEAASKPETPYIWAAEGSLRFGVSSRYYVIMAQAKAERAEESLRALLREKESMRRYAFTEAEIDMAKRSLLSDLTQMAAEKDRQESASYVRDFTAHFLREQNVPDIDWELDAATRLLPALDVRDIAAETRDYFSADDLTILVAAPDAEKPALPSRDRIRELVAESRTASLAPPAVAVLGGKLLENQPIPGAVIAVSQDDETGAILWELSNGTRVILKETRNRNDEIILYAMARGGAASADPADFVSAKLAAEMAEVSGLGPYSRTELTKKLMDKQVSLSFWMSGFLRGFQGYAAAVDIRTLFEMLHLGFTQPRIEAEAVKAMLDQYRTGLIQEAENPDRIFADEVTKTIYGNHPYFKPLEAADLSRVDMNRALELIRRGLNPADYTFVFAGNLDIPVIQELCETYLASIPPGETWNAWIDPRLIRPGKSEKRIYKGKDERSLVFLGWYDRAAYSEEAAAAAAILSEYLDIKMTEEIREKLGGVYSISVGVSVSTLPESGGGRLRLVENAGGGGELIMNVYFVCDPRRVEELSAAAGELLRRTAAGEIDGDAFGKSVEALKKQWETAVQNNAYIARSYANSAVLLEAPLSRLNRRPLYYGAVTREDMQETARRLLQNGPAMVIRYPEGQAR